MAQYADAENDPYPLFSFWWGILFQRGNNENFPTVAYTFELPQHGNLQINRNEWQKYMDVANLSGLQVSGSWWCEPLDIETLINIENNVTIIDKESAITDVSIANDVTLSEQFEVINGATSLFDGMFYFDGGISFDGNRDFVINDVIITEVSA